MRKLTKGMSGNGKNGNYTAAQFIAAIPGSGGIITTIATRVGCAWHTAKKYIDALATVRQAYEDECNKVLDLAESNIFRDLQAHEVQTSKWYLTMKGADRGYIPKETRTVEQSGDVVLRVVYEIDGIDHTAEEYTETPEAERLHPFPGQEESDPGRPARRQDNGSGDPGGGEIP